MIIPDSIKNGTFSEKVMFGLNIAIRKLVEDAALKDEELVIGDKDGSAKLVSAKELLNSLPK